jgi:hypothetical protein
MSIPDGNPSFKRARFARKDAETSRQIHCSVLSPTSVQTRPVREEAGCMSTLQPILAPPRCFDACSTSTQSVKDLCIRQHTATRPKTLKLMKLKLAGIKSIRVLRDIYLALFLLSPSKTIVASLLVCSALESQHVMVVSI